MGLGVGLGTGLGGDGAALAAPAEPNPNLLLWSEELQQATWTISGATTITPDAALDPLGALTADEITFGGLGDFVAQTTGIAATTGAAAILNVLLEDSWDTRYSLTGTFDGTPYYLSCWFRSTMVGAGMQVRLERVGGFLRVSFKDTGDSPVVLVSMLKLETPSLTDYLKREGT